MYYVIRWIGKVYLKLFHNCKIIGKENVPEGPCVICPNHIGKLDPFIVALISKSMLYFVAKIELSHSKILSKFADFVGCVIFINRGTADVGALKKGLKVLRNGEKLIIYPQGHRYKKFNVSQGKKGAASLAIKVDCPIVPVTIRREWKGIIKTVTCIVHKPIMADGRSEKEFTTVVMEKIGEGL